MCAWGAPIALTENTIVVCETFAVEDLLKYLSAHHARREYVTPLLL